MCFPILTQGVEPYIKQIQKLADKNASTLGFIPAQAYVQFVKDKKIFCAVNNNKVVAYVLFRYNRTENKVVLVHVCVDHAHRKSGVAIKLLETIVEQYPLARLVEARCRRDYGLDAFWKKAGFHVANEKPGRSQTGSVLTIWQRPIQTVDLFYLAQQAEAEKKLTAVLDTSIVIELCDEPNGAASCLEDNTLSDYVTYLVTPECADEINTKNDEIIRKKHLSFVNRYHQTAIRENFDKTANELFLRYDPVHAHEADIRHLSHCILNNADVFVTNDQWVCNQREAFRKEYRLDILHPEELYATIEERFDSQAYLSESLVGSMYSENLLSLENLREAAQLAVKAQQGKREFEAWLRSTLTSQTEDVYLVKQQQFVVGLYAISKNSCYAEITEMIISDKKVRPSLQKVLAEAIVERIVNRTAEKADGCTALFVSNVVEQKEFFATSLKRFWKIELGYIKLILKGFITKQNSLEIIANYLSKCPLMTNDEKQQIHKVYEATALHQEIDFEELLSPVIISDLSIDSWLVSIQPKYAVRLFDDKLANTNLSFLHNAHEFAALSDRNSYYTSAKRSFTTPCRIVWYVCYDDAYTGSGSVRAVSTMESAEVGTKKELFSKHKKYGVLDWEEMDEVKAEDKLRVFTFGNTRPLAMPITLKQLKQLAGRYMDKKLQLQSPNRIPNMMCTQILELGVEERA